MSLTQKPYMTYERFKRYPLQKAVIKYFCCLCSKSIDKGTKFHNGGTGKRAHQ